MVHYAAGLYVDLGHRCSDHPDGQFGHTVGGPVDVEFQSTRRVYVAAMEGR